MVIAGVSASELPVGTELQYSGSLTQQSKGSAGEGKTFTVTALALPADSGPSHLVWTLEERGAGGWAWPERFGDLTGADNSKAQSIRLLHTHDGLPHPIAVRSPVF